MILALIGLAEVVGLIVLWLKGRRKYCHGLQHGYALGYSQALEDITGGAEVVRAEHDASQDRQDAVPVPGT